MYTIAKGDRDYSGETFGKIRFSDDGEDNFGFLRRGSRGISPYEIEQLVVSGNARNHKRTMPRLLKFIMPNLYGETVFDNEILSPFHPSNRRFYTFDTTSNDSLTVRVGFSPKINNTQLISGYAIKDINTDRILRTVFSGDVDMLRFAVDVHMQDSTADSCLAVPKSCDIKASFNFLGNKVTSGLSVHYDCPDSAIQHVRSSGNPIVIYARRDTTQIDTIKGNTELVELRDAAWDFIGDHLLSRKEARFSSVRVDMSPLINPLYLSYSHSKGLSYKMKFRGEYTFRNQTAITLKPTVGYNFKLHRFFATVPLRYTFSPSHRDWVELEWSNGNRIHDSKLLGHFDDQKLRLEGNVSATRWLDILAGLVYHRREAVNYKQIMAMGHKILYNSFAPVLQLTLTPLKFGPVFTARYERSIDGVMKSNMEFEKAEFDMSYKQDLGSLRRYSLRAGGGYYFNMKTTYFIDFVNFQ